MQHYAQNEIDYSEKRIYVEQHVQLGCVRTIINCYWDKEQQNPAKFQ